MGNLKNQLKMLALVALLGALLSSVEARYPQLFASSASWAAGSRVHMTVGDRVLPWAKNDKGHHRGIHLAVINPANSEVVAHIAYDTHGSAAETGRLIGAIKHFKGSKVVYMLACGDECVYRVSKTARRAIAGLTGCTNFNGLKYRGAWACLAGNKVRFPKRQSIDGPGKYGVAYVHTNTKN